MIPNPTPTNTIGIIPFKEQPQDTYSLEDWGIDVFAYTEYYQSTLTYKKGIPNQSYTSGWMLLVLLFGFGIIAYVRTMHRKRFSMLVQTFANWKVSKQIIRYEKVYTHPVNILLNMNFILCFTLFFCLAAQHLIGYSGSLNSLFLGILIPLLTYIFSKFLIYKFSGWLMLENEAVEEYVFQANLFNKYLGVVYLILISLLVYSPISAIFLSKLGIIILLLFLSFQLIRGLIIGIEKGKQLYLIILYLCTLEILPWLILGKWVKNLL